MHNTIHVNYDNLQMGFKNFLNRVRLLSASPEIRINLISQLRTQLEMFCK